MEIWSSWEGKKGKMMEKLPTGVQNLQQSWVSETVKTAQHITWGTCGFTEIMSKYTL